LAKRDIKERVNVSPQELQQIVRGEIRQEIYSGPLPRPEDLGRYNEICPGAADRIITVFEKQSEHRRGLEEKVVTSNIRNERLGQKLAFTLALVVICSGVYLLATGKNVIGLTTTLTPLAVLTGVFFGAKGRNRKELTSKK